MSPTAIHQIIRVGLYIAIFALWRIRQIRTPRLKITLLALLASSIGFFYLSTTSVDQPQAANWYWCGLACRALSIVFGGYGIILSFRQPPLTPGPRDDRPST